MPWNFGSLVRFDASLLDKVKLRRWLVEGAQLLEPAIITPGNIDKLLFDHLDDVFQRIVDAIASSEGTLLVGSDGDLLLAGELPVSAAELSQYLASFANLPEASREILKEHPRLMRRLQQFSRADQELIVGQPFLLIALQLLLPLLFQLLFNRFRKNVV
ncbi:MAG: hypothetical protein JNJ77_06245 [Planctomycetia bacterium]|nr:hypothetical protein [Planctomycetia bacterium]